jgi:hypothetical protein
MELLIDTNLKTIQVKTHFTLISELLTLLNKLNIDINEYSLIGTCSVADLIKQSPNPMSPLDGVSIRPWSSSSSANVNWDNDDSKI